MSIAECVALLATELGEEGIPLPYAQRFTLAALAADLCRLAGEDLPAVVARALDEPIHATPRLAVRGSYADHRLAFPEAYAG